MQPKFRKKHGKAQIDGHVTVPWQATVHLRCSSDCEHTIGTWQGQGNATRKSGGRAFRAKLHLQQGRVHAWRIPAAPLIPLMCWLAVPISDLGTSQVHSALLAIHTGSQLLF